MTTGEYSDGTLVDGLSDDNNVEAHNNNYDDVVKYGRQATWSSGVEEDDDVLECDGEEAVPCDEGRGVDYRFKVYGLFANLTRAK